MTFKPFGDRALLIEFEQKIDPEINQQIVALGEAIKMAKTKGIQAIIPAYNSLTICYHPQKTTYKNLCQFIQQLNTKDRQQTNKTHQIPVCYESPYALDLENLSTQLGLSQQAIIEAHSQQTYRVYMLGFLPGFAYMGKLPSQLHCKRKKHPRLKIPEGAVGIAGQQTGIYPSAVPGGWQIIGRTPISIFNPQNKQPFLFQAGDSIQFQPISKEAFQTLDF